MDYAEVSLMKFKKLLMVEVASIITILSLVIVFVEVTPNLVSSSEQSIGVYNQKEFAIGTATLRVGEMASAQFNYSTFDPAILVIDLTFQNWQTPGDLSILCNGRNVATVLASTDNHTIRITTISVSGRDWVKPPSVNSYTYGNEVTFKSEPQNGFEGTFSYNINIRGSR